MKNLILIISILITTPACGIQKALIFGITGQDGAYLAEFLLEKGYEVHGVKRRSSSFNTQRIDHLYRDFHASDNKLILHYGDLADSANIAKLIHEIQPDEVYNLGAQSHVRVSFDIPEYTADIDALGTLRILEAIKNSGKPIRYYQASSSEMFGKVTEIPQTEHTPFYPRSPYGCAKVFAYWITINYREAYDIFACNGILFNHESPLRGETFVTRKITRAIARMFYGLQDILYLGNLDSQRDWGYAKDYVEAMWLMLQHETPGDYVIATGQTHSVREFVELAFKYIGVDLIWQGSGIDEKGVDAKTGHIYVAVDPVYFRPTEVDLLIGDPSYAQTTLGWQPRTDLQTLLEIMMEADLKAVAKECDPCPQRPVTIAILVKDKAHTLPLYLNCIEAQTWPKSQTYLYIRTNNNNDNSATILREWVQKVQSDYLGIYFDDSDVTEDITQYKQHEWNCTRFKVLGKIRQQSLDWAHEHGSHYFVADCDNFIFPQTIEQIAALNLPIVGPLLNSNCAYSNFHAAIDANGYMADSSIYLPLVNREIKGLVQVPVIHCTYFVNYNVLEQMSYDDESYRYEYVIFSDTARKKNIPQYLDTRDVYGYVTFAENSTDLVKESWFIGFCNSLYNFKHA